VSALLSRIPPEIPVKWIICWLLLPNMAVVLMWQFAGLKMQALIIMAGIAALIFSQIPSLLVRTVGAISIFSMISMLYVARLFGIPPLNFSVVAQFLTEVRPLRSPEYALAGAVMAVILILIVRLTPRVERFHSRKQFLAAGVAILLFGLLDSSLAQTQWSGLKAPVPGRSVDSAVKQTGFTPAAAQGRHVLVIMVEALGKPVGAPERELFEADWNRANWRSRYAVQTGSTRFEGSTIYGELREMCGTTTHYEYFDFSKADCLPKRFAQAGYETTSMHSFDSGLFERTTWYPKTGFKTMMFDEELAKAGAGACEGVFPGRCDVDVAKLVKQRLSEADKPQFIYWLTLNSHSPVIADGTLGTNDCTLGTQEWRYALPVVCRLFEVHHTLANSIDRLVMAPDLPPVDILIIGDHRPPMFDRQANARFDQDHVPWVYLRAKDRTELAAR
jgi:hypothetical protein